MDRYIEQRLIQLLRDSPSSVVSLRDLHCALSAEAGSDAGSCSLLEESLRRRRDLFVVLEPISPFGDADAWPAGTRSAYERALAAAGVDTGPHVALVDAVMEPDDLPPAFTVDDPLAAPLRQLRDSLLRIWQTAGANAALRGSVAAALAGCMDLPAALRAGDDARS